MAPAGAALSVAAPLAAAPPEAPTGATTEPPPAPADGTSLALLRDHVRHTFSYNRLTLAGHIIGAAVVLYTFWDVAPADLRWG